MNKSSLDQDIVIKEYNIQAARSTIFFNPTNHKSLRLTKSGWNVLGKQVKSYKFELPVAILPKTLIQLERYIEHPYYIHSLKLISIFDEQTAVMLALHANNLQKYLDDLESH